MYKLFIFFLILFNCLYTKNFNILIVSVGRFPPIQGTAVLNHITGLLDLGCSVEIFSYEIASYVNLNQDIIKFDLMNKLIVKNIPENMDKYDVILAETGSRGNEFLLYKSKKNKLVICFRGSDVGKALQEDSHCYDQLFREGDLFLPVCESFKQELIAHGCPREKIEVLHSTIDCNIFNYNKRVFKKNEPVKIISVCRLVEKKGLEYAINAIASLIKKGFRIKYTIIGEGKLYSSLKALIENLDMQNNIYLVGRKGITQVVEYLHNNHLFILPSINAENGDEEGISNAAKEAMACGLPVILTDHSGNAELIENAVSGILIQQKSIEALEDAIMYLIENKRLWNKFGKAGRKKIEKDFEKNRLNKKLFDLLVELTREKV